MAEVAAAHTKESQSVSLLGLTWRSALLAIAFTVLASYWIDQAEVVTFFCQITESVPAIPAVAFLVALVLLSPMVGKLCRYLALDRREILVIYVFLAVATSMAGCGIIRFWINTIPVLYYFATPDNDYAEFQQYVPRWWIPQDPEIIRQLYEGSPTGAIPWRPWVVPIVAWGLLYLFIWIGLMGISALFHRQWSEREKLTYPLLYLPLEVTKGLEVGRLVGDFFRNRLMWIGFILATIYNLTNIANAYNPGIACLGKYYSFDQLFTERPWSSLRPMVLHYRPEMIGFGYLVSTEVAFSVWAFYLLLKFERFVAVLLGYDIPGMPFMQEQGIGAYIALGCILIWVARGHLSRVVRAALFGEEYDDSREALSWRLALLCTVGGFALTVLWTVQAGMKPWFATAYIGLIFLVALVYARMRAEVGVPLIWMFPYYQHYKLFKYALGSKFLYEHAGWQSLTVFSTLVILSRGYYPSLQGYQVEAYKLAEETSIRPRSMSAALLIALVVGYYVAVWLHLRSYYQYGAGGLRALEGWGAGLAKSEYSELAGYLRGLSGMDVSRTVATVAGFLIASALFGIRSVFLRFPLHPLAWGMVTAYGDLIWGTFVIVWLVKTLVFKLGGMRWYRALIPAFIGLALGHFFTAGVLYSLIGSYSSEKFRRYAVWFG
ncbi:MAG: hypothetical protein H5T86_01850 [Armatimonadetes bacterium]|nr:hypothetical protein [Armatimonadota bacterium]